ncbi:hybrid sensor histidine kinase/response regulator [Sulfurimonas lithotrophica]|uniref:histidine kinase n=1 Tax=Sulfurimonas lithotrophica TaxID=2590022 RepID=A0A5P8P3S2_9BACT|nr:hybrid sensor histidine kinase/response regulator [Sulfurimonas lithotrophica]QFR50261.1 hybrid sensor histidine kinase/response regulator [Sulfurimonas lithotrophica]
MYKVLIVDDSLVNISLMQEILSDEYDIDSVLSAKEALQKVEEEQFDIILLDISMPEMDGYDVIKILKSNDKTKDIPVIFVSALSENADEIKGLELGAVDYITKPVINSLVKARVATHIQLSEQKKELSQYKNYLEHKVEEEISKRKEQEKVLFQQSKLAAMGEMMDAVAHQWTQPLSLIGLRTSMLASDYEYGEVDLEYLKDFELNISEQIQHMSETLNEFRSFFRPNKKTEKFDVKSMINSALHLLADELMKNTIEVCVNEVDKFEINGIENEMKHLVLNIINNAKDAFNEKDIKNRKIQINILKDKKHKKIEIIDNAGGIPEDIIDDIFKANVTTKEEGKGTGIGLYMTDQIAQKHNGTLKAVNVLNGAKFILELPLN